MRFAPYILLMLCGIARADEPSDGGAVISVQVGDGGTHLEVQRGELKVRAGGQETRVGAGESVHAEKTRPLKHILRAPTNLAPADGASVSTLAFSVRFDKVPGAKGYQMVVAADPQFGEIVWRADHVETTKIDAKLQKAGTYWWKVVAVNAQSEPVGKPSPARKVVIDLTPPKLKAGQPRWK
jgi:hypothetical protein